jgi:hypothetical protein
MTDLSSLPPEVREVFSNMAADSDCWLGAHDADTLRDYIIRVTAEKKELDAMLTAQFARRIPVEQALLDVANGKRELPTREECRKWATKIGVPNERQD